MGEFKNRWSYDASIIAYLYAIRRATRDLSTHRSGNAVFIFSMATLAPELAIDLSRRPGNDVDAKRAQYKTAMLIEIVKYECPRWPSRIFETLGYFPFRSRRVIYCNVALCRNKQDEVTLFISGHTQRAGEENFLFNPFSLLSSIKFTFLIPRGIALECYNVKRALLFSIANNF